jgi:hypothetical protein
MTSLFEKDQVFGFLYKSPAKSRISGEHNVVIMTVDCGRHIADKGRYPAKISQISNKQTRRLVVVFIQILLYIVVY